MGKLADDIADGLGYWGAQERALVARVAQLEAEFEELVTFTRAKLVEWDEAQEEIRVLREANEQLTDQIVRGVPETLMDGPDSPRGEILPGDELSPKDASITYQLYSPDATLCTGFFVGADTKLMHDEHTFCPVHDVER